MNAIDLTPLEVAINERQGKQEGGEIRFLCPAHDDQNPSARYNPEKTVWRCDVCNTGGGFKDLAKRLGVSLNGQQARVSQPKGKIIKTYDYTDADGKLLFQVARSDPKDFRQRRPDGNGGWIWNLKGVDRVLYRLPEVLEAISDNETVFKPEGEKDADNLVDLGLCATTCAQGASGWLTKYNYSDTLKDANVVILPDNDDAGRKHAAQVAQSLQGKAASIKIVALPGLDHKGDVSDWLESHGRGELLELVQDTPEYEPLEDAEPPEDEQATKQPSQSQKLIELAREHTSDLFHDADKAAYALIPVRDHYEVQEVRAKAFRSLLYRLYYEATSKPPSAQAMQDALAVIEAKALFDGEQREVFVRLAEYDGKVYLDLANDSWQVVEIDASGWRVTARSPVMFRRPKGLEALPLPADGGSLDDLRTFVNVSEDDWALIVAYLVACLRPGIPYPLLVLIAEQGSGKSTLARMIKRLIDGNAAPLRSEPREARDLMIGAHNGWLLAFDNLSSIPGWLSDALCRLSTGGGFSTRTLYANDEETIFNAMRPVLLTGIDELATRGDLLDRSLIVNLKQITKQARRPEKELWRDFEAKQPRILGALLSAVSEGLRRESTVKLETMPRMADFAVWASACEKALELEQGRFLKAYTANRSNANELALDVSPVPEYLRELVEKHNGTWEGTASDLQGELDDLASEKVQKQKAWPKSARSVGNALRRLAPNLRETGLSVNFFREANTGRRLTRISLQNDVANVTNVTKEDKHREGRKNNGDVKGDDVVTFENDVTLTSPEFLREGRSGDNSDVSDVKKQSHSISWDEV